MPLADPATNKDYFCGEGMGSKLCPPGSYCHKSSAFSKCCREIILIKTCSEAIFGCCPDGSTSAQGPNNAGCPSVCNCNRLGSFGLTCDPISKQCFCKPGVGGPHCDRCEPGYWGLHRITDENSEGCTPCTCNLYGSVRDDCEQMTGRCVCKQGIQGMKCDICPERTVLTPDGCVDESIAQPISGSCDELMCFHGAQCKEVIEGHAQCICDIQCSIEDSKDPVCGSDGNTYGSECQMKLFSCRYQKTITIAFQEACAKELHKRKKNYKLKRSLPTTIFSTYNPFGKRTQHAKENIFSTQQNYNMKFKHKKRGEIKRLEPNAQYESITIEFSSLKTNGVLLAIKDFMNESKTIILLNIRNRFVEVWMKTADEITRLRPDKQVIPGRCHTVSIEFDLHFVAVYLDSKWRDLKYINNKNSTFQDYLTKSDVTVAPDIHLRHLNSILKEFPKLVNFIGCVHKIEISRTESSRLRTSILQSEEILRKSVIKPQRMKKDIKLPLCLPFLNGLKNSTYLNKTITAVQSTSTDEPDTRWSCFTLLISQKLNRLYSWFLTFKNDEEMKDSATMEKKEILVVIKQEKSRNEIFSSENITMNNFQGVKIEVSKSEILFCVDEECKTIHLKETNPVTLLLKISTPMICGTFSLELGSPAEISTEISFLAHELPYSASRENVIQRICYKS